MGVVLASIFSPGTAAPTLENRQNGGIAPVSGIWYKQPLPGNTGTCGAFPSSESVPNGFSMQKPALRSIESNGENAGMPSDPDRGTLWRSHLPDRRFNMTSAVHDRMNHTSYAGRMQPVPTWITGEGIIRLISLEGEGFFGIVTGAGDQYLPDNLPRSLAVDGIRVTFRGIATEPSPGVLMWGSRLHLISIDKTGEAFTSLGTVTFVDLEGGFFGIVTDAGDHYLPLNLPEEYRIDGMRVVFTAYEERDTATYAMWGIPVQLASIAPVDQPFGPINGSWYLNSYSDGESLRPVLPGTSISAEFGDDGTITGTSGCNHYFGSYQLTGTTIAVGPIGSTKMYCSLPEGCMEQESAYFDLLGMAATFSFSAGQLHLLDGMGRELLVFSAEKQDLSQESGSFIEYSRTGGFAGFDDHLTIYSNGTASVQRKESERTIMIDPGTLSELEILLDTTDFALLKEQYPATQNGADYFRYSLTFGGKTVTTQDTAIPDLLVLVFNILDEIIGSSAPDDVIPPFPG